MLFIFGISSGTKQLNFQQTMICKNCGQYGRLNVFIIYSYFSLFFIPIFKWGKQYYAKTSCCNTLYKIENEIGKKIEHGESITLTDTDLHFVKNEKNNFVSYCSKCGQALETDFEYCPKCGFKVK